MSDPRTDLPSPSAPNFEQRIRETLMTYLGRQGNLLDRGITLRDLVENGIVKLPAGHSIRPGGPMPPLLPGVPADGELDLTPPPQPTGFAVASAISHIFIEHDAPLYPQGGGHLRTRVYGVTMQPGDPLPTFENALEITQFSGTVHAHPSNPATTWRLWIKWETRANRLSATPAGGTNGLEVTTAQDVGLLLQALTGQITEGQLHGALGSRIDLIDGLADLPGSVNARIQAEVDARVLTLQAEANARTLADNQLQTQIDLLGDIAGGDVGNLINAINQEIADRIAGDLAEADARALADSGLSAAIVLEQSTRANSDTALAERDLILATSIGNNISAVIVEQATRATADSAAAEQITTLGAATANNLSGLIIEQAVRADSDFAFAGQVTALVAAAGGNSSSIQIEQQARADADGALSAQTSTLASVAGENAAALLIEQQSRADADSAAAEQITSLLSATGENLAGLLVEQVARTDADSATASQVVSLAGVVADSAAALVVEQQVRAESDLATSALTTTLTSEVGGNAAALQAEMLARADADSAAALVTSTLAASVSDNAAGLFSEQILRADQDSAQASILTGLAVSSGANSAGILSEQQARATEDAALASQITSVAASTASTSAALTNEINVRAGETSALAQQTTTLAARLAVNSEQTVFSEFWDSADAISLWQNYSGLGELSIETTAAAATGGRVLRVGNNAGNDQAWLVHTGLIPFDQGRLYRVTVRARRLAGTGIVYFGWAGVLADGITLCNTSGGNTSSSQHYHVAAGAAPAAEWQTFVGYTQGYAATGTGGTASQETSPGRVHTSVRYLRPLILVNYNGVAGTTEVDSFVVEDITESVNRASSLTQSFTAAIQTEQQVRADADGALAQQTTTLQALREEDQAALELEAFVRSVETENLLAQYTVKLDVNGYVAGFGLASEKSNGRVTSEFAVRADRFYIASPSGPGVRPTMPFIVQTTPTTINGVAVPVGVYMSDAYLQNGTVTNLKVANGAIDDLKVANVSAGKLVAGSIAVGQHIQSTGYIAGSAGWRINGDGTAELSGVIVRGTIYATAGQIGGITIASNAVRAGQTAYNTGSGFHLGSDGRFSLGNSSGNRLTWDGTNLSLTGALNAATGTFAGSLSAATGTFAGSLSAATGTFSGNLSAAGGTFAGSLSAATGTFSGSLTASAVNAVDTINLAGNAVTFPVSAVRSSSFSTSSTTFQTVLSVSMDSAGAPVWVHALLKIDFPEQGAAVAVYSNGALVYSETMGGGHWDSASAGRGVAHFSRQIASTPTSPFAIEIRARSLSAGAVVSVLTDSILFAIGTKK